MTLPMPPSLFFMVKVKVLVSGLFPAGRLHRRRSDSIVTVQEPLPAQPPPPSSQKTPSRRPVCGQNHLGSSGKARLAAAAARSAIDPRGRTRDRAALPRLDSERVRLARRREVRADRAVRGQRQPANVGTRAAAPVQPANVEPLSARAVKTTSLPPAKLASQLPPQSIPEGELVTVPAPFPVVSTASVCVSRRREVRADRAVRGQRQPANVGTRAAAPRPTGKRRAALGAGSQDDLATTGKLASQLPPQSIPEGELVTVPAPFPVVSTASVCVSRAGAKSALTERFAVSVSLQTSVPEQPLPSNRQTSSRSRRGQSRRPRYHRQSSPAAAAAIDPRGRTRDRASALPRRLDSEHRHRRWAAVALMAGIHQNQPPRAAGAEESEAGDKHEREWQVEDSSEEPRRT